MSIIYYHHFHPNKDMRSVTKIDSNTPIPYDYAGTGFFSDRIYHSRNSNARFYVITFGYEKSWGKTTSPRIINRCILHFIFDGKGKFNGIPAKKGDIVVIPPNKKHTIQYDSDAPMTLGWIALAGRELELMNEILHLPTDVNASINDCQLKKIEDIFLDTVYNPHLDVELPFFLFSRLFDVLSHARILYTPTFKTDNKYIDKAMAFINTHYASDITVYSIANELHLSPSRLRRIFSEELGYSPQEAIIQKRLAIAQSLLLSDSPPPIQNIASMCGYTDQSAFSRRFKREFGCSPSEYVKTRSTK